VDDRITLTLRYSFRGETLQPRVTLDLDRAMRARGRLPDFVEALARANGIDVYSHEYEVLPYGEFIWSDARGLAVECLREGRFDTACYERRWRERERCTALRAIARTHLNISDPDRHPQLFKALEAAWLQGVRASWEAAPDSD